MLSPPPARPPAARTLAARYDAAAARWHGKIARLGYCRAYAELCAAFAAEARPGGAALRVLDALLLAVSRPHWCTWLLQRIRGHRALPVAAVVGACARAGFAQPRVFAVTDGPPSRTSRGYAARA